MNKKPERDYKAIIEQLKSLRAHASSMAVGGEEIWSYDVLALDEAISIIQDYMLVIHPKNKKEGGE